jgi:hypothetical protein
MGLPISAIIMLVIGSVLIYGSLAYFVYRALKSIKSKK